jgi:large subunit ribosomal protein L27
MGTDHTIFALIDGTVRFRQVRKDRQCIDIVPAEAAS